MISRSMVRPALRGPRSRSQRGYVLGVVLGAMVIGLSLITALLGLSFTTHRAAVVQQELARERRAADGALEVAVERVAAADPDTPCPAGPLPVAMDLNGDPGDDGDPGHGWEEVFVSCEDDLDPDAPAEGDVRILGAEDYGGDAPWTDSPDPGDVSLLHQGTEALRFVGSVLVGDGAAVVGTERGATVTNRYVQGDPGTGGAGTECGIISPNGGDPSRSIDTGAGSPACGDSDLKSALQSDTKPATVAKPVADVLAGSLPDPSVCPPGTVAFSPGYYPPSSTDRLNQLFGLGCNVTYHFTPGNYWFDAPGADPVLRFQGAGSAFVFGDLVGGASPPACDPDGSPTTVVIGSASSFEHLGGRLSICAGASNTSPALVASGDSAEGNPRLVDLRNFGGSFTHFDNVGGAVADEQSGAASAEICQPGTCRWRKLRATVEPTTQRDISSLALRWHSEETPQTSPGRRWIYVTLTRADGQVVCATPQPPVEPERWRGRTGGLGSELNLTGDCVNEFLGNESQLEGATLEVGFRTDIPIPGISGCLIFSCPWSMSVWDMELVVNAATVEAGVANSSDWSPGAGLLAADGSAAVAEDCPPYPFTWIPISPWSTGDEINGICDRGTESPTPSVFELTGFPVPDGMAPDDQLSSLVLAIDNEEELAPDVVAGRLNFADLLELGSTTVTVSNGVSSCTFEKPGYTRSRQTYFFDIGAECGSLVNLAAEVADLTITVSVLPERNMIIDGFVEGPGVELPRIEYARLLATSSTFDEVRTAKVVIDEGAGSSFEVHGTADLRLVDLDLAWNGTASEVPLVTGDLKLNALSSVQADTSGDGVPDADVGVVCCGPDRPAVRLEARMTSDPSDPIRGLARLRLEPGLPPVRSDWQLCHLDGCPL